MYLDQFFSVSFKTFTLIEKILDLS